MRGGLGGRWYRQPDGGFMCRDVLLWEVVCPNCEIEWAWAVTLYRTSVIAPFSSSMISRGETQCDPAEVSVWPVARRRACDVLW